MLDYHALAEKTFDYVVEMRRYFHKYPELSRQEVETSKRICQELAGMNVEFKAYPDNTVVAIIDSGKPGKTLLSASPACNTNATGRYNVLPHGIKRMSAFQVVTGIRLPV